MNEEGGGVTLTPTQGTYLIGLSNAIPAILAILTIQVFGRRTIFITGQFFMAIWLFFFGYFMYEAENLVSLITLCLFLATF